jgi:hypothetical protein
MLLLQAICRDSVRVSGGLRLSPVSTTNSDGPVENLMGNRTHLLVMFRGVPTTNRVSYVPGLLTVRSRSALSVSLSKTETSVQNPGDDEGCHLEPRRWGGKSTVTALLGLSLRDMGKKLGLLDVDFSVSSLYKVLGLQSPPRLRTSTVRRKLIPPQVMGMRLFSICAHFGEGNAVMWKAETGIVEIPDEVRKGIRKQT